MEIRFNLLSEPFPANFYRRTIKTRYKKLLLTVWLLTCVVLLSSFSGEILTFFMKNVTVDAIDSFEQLYGRKDVKIITPSKLYFNKFVQQYKNTNYLAKDFIKRLLALEILPLENPNHSKTIEMVKKLKSGKYVLVVNKSIYNSQVNCLN